MHKFSFYPSNKQERSHINTNTDMMMHSTLDSDTIFSKCLVVMVTNGSKFWGRKRSRENQGGSSEWSRKVLETQP